MKTGKLRMSERGAGYISSVALFERRRTLIFRNEFAYVCLCICVCVRQVDAKIIVNRTQHATEAKSAQSK